MAASSEIAEKDLQRWRLIERFRAELEAELKERGGPSGTWADPRRQVELGDYLSLYLFGLFNPVVDTMRGLCGASKLGRVQREVCGGKISLGSFSEAQAVVDQDLLRGLFVRIKTQAHTPPPRPRFTGRERVVDSSVWQVLPRMTWAFWRRQGGLDNAVRLHVAFDLATGQVDDAKLTPAKTCERKQWRKFARVGTCDIGDRYYSYDYKQLADLQAAGTDFIVRLRIDACWVEMFFRWLKCILGCRKWLAESERGVAMQVYLALIAAQLLVLYSGQRPNRRQMEAIQFFLMGWATTDELVAILCPAVGAKNPARAKKA
jgi:hypothetical protein